MQPCFYIQSVIGSVDLPGGEVGLDMELLIVKLKYNISHLVVVEIVRVLCFSSRTRRFLHKNEHHIKGNLSHVRKVECVLQGTLSQKRCLCVSHHTVLNQVRVDVDGVVSVIHVRDFNCFHPGTHVYTTSIHS